MTKSTPGKHVPGTDLAPKIPIPVLLLFLLPLFVLSFVGEESHPFSSIPALWRVGLIAVVGFGSLFFTLAKVVRGFIDPRHRLSQDQRYHAFADRRPLSCCGLHVPNRNDCFSNLPFLIGGLAGVFASLQGTFRTEMERVPYLIFFAGVALVAFGSFYYHLRPTNSTLVWDRLPMTVGFLGSYCAVIEERVGGGLGYSLLVPLLSLGIFSVVYWHLTDDLTLYAWVQFFPLLTIPVITALFPTPYTGSWALFATLALYAAAKVAEARDKDIFKSTGGAMSGHTLKHLLSAVGPCFLAYAVNYRVVYTSS